MNKVSIIRRVNLGDYEYWEFFVEIEDIDENSALKRAMDLMNKALTCVSIPKIDTRKLN